MNKKNDFTPFMHDDNSAWEEYIKTGKELCPSQQHVEAMCNASSRSSQNGCRSPIRQGTTAGIDRNTAEKLQKGLMPIDVKLDLHGYTIEDVHNLLIPLIMNAYKHQKRMLLIITGKGRNSDTEDTLNTYLPRILRSEPLANIVLFFDYAQPKHGGHGAYYIYLKKHK